MLTVGDVMVADTVAFRRMSAIEILQGDGARVLSSQLDQGGDRVKLTFEVAFEGLLSEAAKVGGAGPRPVF